MNRCKQCILPINFPGLIIDENGICNYCAEFKGLENLEAKKSDYKQKFETLLTEYKSKNSYDALMCFSGGKDSAYTLSLLKEKFDLNILSVTLDNSFLSKQAVMNIKNVTESLGIDHILFKPSFKVIKKIFTECSKENIFSPKTIERASTICTCCMSLVRFSSLRLAIEKNIPFIIYGWSPGQAPIKSSIMKNNPNITKMMQKVIFEPLYDIVGDKIKPYFLEETHFNGQYEFPYNISPLAFLEYNEEKIYKKIYQLGWEDPKDTDATSTNCILNSYAIHIHKKKYNFNPYVFHLANLVREGNLDRNTALERIHDIDQRDTIELVRKRLGIK
jgi:tRNA(Ile)-lysidine synthase TilS/MesJ